MAICKEIFVSRYHGNNLPSCGRTNKTACKTIALATTQAQWDDTIYIDGTETSRDPYPCLSTTPHSEGIYVNKSLFFERFGNDEAILKCSSTRQMLCDGRNVTENVVIRFKGLIFFNSHVTVQNCSLYVENCLFKDAISFPNATAVVNFESFEEQFTLTIRNCLFRNNSYPCVRVAGSRPKIEVYGTAFINNTAIWEGETGASVAVFIVLLPTKQTASRPGFSMTFTNTSFIRNMAPFGGSLYIQASSVYAANRQMVKWSKSRRDMGCMTVVSQPYSSTEHYARQLSREIVSFEIVGGRFLHNVGGAVTQSGVRVVNISVNSCVFVNNSSPLVGGALLFEGVREFVLHIVDTEFVENSAKNGGSALYVMAVSSKTVLVIVRNVLFLGNVLHEPDFIPDFPNGGALTIVMPGGYLKVLLENVLFLFNKAARGSSTLHLDGYSQETTIKDSTFHGNSQDERFLHDWKIAVIDSFRLNFTLTRTVVSENYAKPRADNNTLAGQPIHFIVSASYLARMNVSDLQYNNNKGGGMFIQLGMNDDNNNSTCFLQDSHFENNDLFSLEIKVKSNSLLQINRLIFKANSFVSSVLQCLALFFLFVTADGKGNQIIIESTTFENNTHVTGNIVLFRLPPDQKDPYACDTPNWVYKNNVAFTKVLFRKNNFQYFTVLRLENGWNILRNCLFDNNYGSRLGSNLFIGEGSAHLEVINTSLELTPRLVHPDFRGFIYFASSGSIKLINTLLSVKAFQDIDSYLMVTDSSNAQIDNSSVIQCPIGTIRKRSDFSHVHFIVTEACPSGLYITRSQSFTFSCKRCPPGFYSVEPFEQKCRSCPYGANCSSNVAAKPTFWGFPSLSDQGLVKFQQCPSDYCCQYQNISCPYDNQRYLLSGCSGNRTGFLCGACKAGFSETLFSSRCQASNDCTDYWFWPVALVYSLAFACFLLWKSPIINVMKKLLPWKLHVQSQNTENDSASDGGGYIKIVFYFYQVASLLFVSNDSEIHLAETYLLLPVVGWFDFKAVNSNKGFICPCRGLTVVSKMFLHASQVFAVLSGLLIIFLVHGAIRNFKKQSPVFASSGSYLAATTECFLLGYSTLALTALKALNYVEIQSTSRFFYDGNIRCWQWWQKLCGVYIFVFIVPFVFILYRGSKLLHVKAISTKQFLYACLFPLPFAIRWTVLCKKPRPVNNEQIPLLPPADRLTRDTSPQDLTAYVIYGPFKKDNDGQGSGAVYWESVLIGRRLILISLHIFIVFPFIRMVCLSVMCAFILAHHLWKKPFKDPRANHGETASLTALLVLAVINMAEINFAVNGEVLSEQERVCLIVLQVVEVIILGTVPVAFTLLIVVSVLWQLLKFCKLCGVTFWRLYIFVINNIK